MGMQQPASGMTTLHVISPPAWTCGNTGMLGRLGVLAYMCYLQDTLHEYFRPSEGGALAWNPGVLHGKLWVLMQVNR